MGSLPSTEVYFMTKGMWDGTCFKYWEILLMCIHFNIIRPRTAATSFPNGEVCWHLKRMPVLLGTLVTMLIVSPEHQELCFKVCLLVFEVLQLPVLGSHSFFSVFLQKGSRMLYFLKKAEKQFEYSQKLETVKNYKLDMICNFFFLGFIANY